MSLQHNPRTGKLGDSGYAMVALLVTISIMSVVMGLAMPVWRQAAQREKEAELAWRGEQYARAIGLFQRKHGGAFPPNLQLLVDQKFLRRKYKDPMTKDGEFQILFQAAQAGRPGQVGQRRPGVPAPDDDDPNDGAAPSAGSATPGATAPPTSAGSIGALGAQGGIVGVTSKSKEKSIRLYKGRGKYNEWQFVYVAVTTEGGAGGGSRRPGEGAAGKSRPGQPSPGQTKPRPMNPRRVP